MGLQKIACAVTLAMASAGSALATPLTMEYAKTALGGGLFQYDFTLALDNHDGSWAAGQQWDWIVFGDTDSSGSLYKGFDPDGTGGAAAAWTTTGYSAPISNVTSSWGAHNGATLAVGATTVALPGWQPLAVGDEISWAGVSTVNFLAGQMTWSALVTGGGAQRVNFDVAHRVASIPEPSALALVALALALAGLAATRSKARLQGLTAGVSLSWPAARCIRYGSSATNSGAP